MTTRRRNVRWTDREAAGWRIDEGPSRFLIAEGSGWSRKIGRELFHRLKWGVELRHKQLNAVERP